MAIVLRKHQVDAVNFIENSKHLGVLLWHGMGLGKTISSLTYTRNRLSTLRKEGINNPKFMVIIPKSAISTWQDECRKETPDLYKDMLLIPYSQLNKAPKLIQYYDIRIIIMDESHYIKSPETNRAKDLSEMFLSLHKSPHAFNKGKVILLSGTPMLNSAAELYTSWAILSSPNALEASIRVLGQEGERYAKWTQTFAQKKETSWKKRNGEEKRGSNYEGVANSEMLKELLSPVVHYRRVSDCIDLPDKQETHIDLNLPDDKLLKDADIEEPEAYMALLERLSRAKTPHAIEWIKEFLHSSEDQLVLFSSYKFPIQEIFHRFVGKVVLVTGEETGAERKMNIEAFQKGKKRIIAMTYRAGAESLNLQNSCKALYLGFPWHDAAIKQAMARIYRQGQKNFTNHYFLFSGFNDKRILSLVRAKGQATSILEDALVNVDSVYTEKSLDFYI